MIDRARTEWLALVYGADLAGGSGRADPALAASRLADNPGLAAGDPNLACAVGDVAAVAAALAADPAFANRAGGPLELPPLVAATHSRLCQMAAFRAGIIATADLLLNRRAHADQSVAGRAWPASRENPSPHRLSALYGAAGVNHDSELTYLLLRSGANPNDGESLYHSLPHHRCTGVLLEAGARIAGTNAMFRQIDFDDLEGLQLLLSFGGDPNEPATSRPTSDWGSPLLWAIRRRRSAGHVRALLAAGADARARTPHGVAAYRLAVWFALPEAADALAEAGGSEPLGEEDRFIAACTRGEAASASALKARRPDLPASLPEPALRLLPEFAALGCREAVAAMASLGWPIETRGGDWEASALNHAVFRGDVAMTRQLLEHGADWQETHGHGDNVAGTLAWASSNAPVADGDWAGCAAALLAGGMPAGRPGPADQVIIGGVGRSYSAKVRDVLLGG